MRIAYFSLSIILSVFLLISCGTESTPVYTLSTSVNGEGTITPSGGEYKDGEVVTLIANPTEHWVFNNWSGDGSGSSTSLSITMDRDKNVVGNFIEREYSINYTINGSGSVDVTVILSKSQYKVGTVVELTPVPANGWEFVEWTDWDGEVDDEDKIIVTVDGEVSITVTFERIDYPLTITIEGEGIVEKEVVQSKTTEYPYETVVQLTPKPSEGWRFVEWTDWGGEVDEENKIIVTMSDEINITVKFSPIIYLGENGITIMCPYGEVGYTGIVNGVEYEVVDRNLLIERRDEGSDLTKVCVSLVIDMSNLLRGEYEIKNPFNQPIGNWDVSNVTSMNNMFIYTQFNQPIGEWDVNNVTDMRGMFWDSPFNQPIGKWNVSMVEDMGYMFFESDFNQPIGNWNVSQVKNMIRLFSLSPFNQSIEEWDVSNVTNMSGMFADSPFNQPIGKWNVSKVEDMWKMFLYTPFNQPIGEWDMSNVTNMGGIFSYSQFNQPISDWDVSNVTNMSSTFAASPFNQSIENWDVSSVKDMSRMFLGNNDFNQPIGNWNLSNVTAMDYMFMGSQFDQPIGEWDVSNVTNMDFMFRNSFFNQNISNWCVWRIGTEPNEFSQGSPLTPENKPIWGTCPD